MVFAVMTSEIEMVAMDRLRYDGKEYSAHAQKSRGCDSWC